MNRENLNLPPKNWSSSGPRAGARSTIVSSALRGRPRRLAPTTEQPARRSVRLLMTDPERNEVLKAALPLMLQHPRALLTLLESLSIWVGQPLIAAVSAAPSVDRRCAEALFEDGLLPLDSALVRFDMLAPGQRRRTFPGVGDFRQLRLLHGRWS